MKKYFLILIFSSLTSCGSEYEYIEPGANFTVYTVSADGSPVSVEVTYEKMPCDYDFLYPDYVLTDQEGSGQIHISDGYYQFYCKSGPYKAYSCVNLRKGDRSIKLVLE